MKHAFISKGHKKVFTIIRLYQVIYDIYDTSGAMFIASFAF